MHDLLYLFEEKDLSLRPRCGPLSPVLKTFFEGRYIYIYIFAGTKKYLLK